jgi:hypothetical protein
MPAGTVSGMREGSLVSMSRIAAMAGVLLDSTPPTWASGALGH